MKIVFFTKERLYLNNKYFQQKSSPTFTGKRSKNKIEHKTKCLTHIIYSYGKYRLIVEEARFELTSPSFPLVLYQLSYPPM